MNPKIMREISRNVPDQVLEKLPKSTAALLTAFDCVLMERYTGSTFIYYVVNLKTGRRETISRRTAPLRTSGVEAMVEKIRTSGVAGAGRFEADRPTGNGLAINNCREMLDTVFKDMLPQYGYAVRNEQISLAHHILDAIGRRAISLAEGEVGTGKTLAYLVPAILAKRGRLNGYCNMSFHAGSQYIDLINMPIVIATSSIALQKAIIADYIPELSKMLLEYGIIRNPITAVLRKGREHYVCEYKVRSHIPFEHSRQTKEVLSGLLKPNADIDLAEIEGLANHVKQKISVPDRCGRYCKFRDTCAYLRFREQAQSLDIDIQVCNHNYLLADIIRRNGGKSPLIPNYQMAVIDEAHKFLHAARSMYGVELSSRSLPEIKAAIGSLSMKHENEGLLIKSEAKILANISNKLFKRLIALSREERGCIEDEPDRFTASMDEITARHLRSICGISDNLLSMLDAEPVVGKGGGRKAQIIWELEQIRSNAVELRCHGDLICWIEKDNNEDRLCAIPKNLSERLYGDIWNKGIPIILTSGTLSAGGDFSRTKKSLGLDRIYGNRITEASKASPFDYMKNSLLYIAEDMPFPDQGNPEYISAAAVRIKELVYASHGHAAVLFTSYKVMDQVWGILSQEELPFPMFRLGKGTARDIEYFKKSGNGILFAAGALWEGIDIPGDALSMLIIVKLPFPIPDPISEYERSLYDSNADFKSDFIIPEAAIKTKQGYGRGYRTESDTCVTAFLDCRMGEGGFYRRPILAALPDCEVTGCIGDVYRWIEEKKSGDYFA